MEPTRFLRARRARCLETKSAQTMLPRGVRVKSTSEVERRIVRHAHGRRRGQAGRGKGVRERRTPGHGD